MMSFTSKELTAALRVQQFGWLTNMIVSWTLAGGVAGGVLMALLVFTSRVHAMGVVVLVIIVSALGSMLGAVHGAVLGYLGRHPAEVRFDWRGWTTLAAATVAAAGFGVGFAVWLAISAMAANVGDPFGTFAFIISMFLSTTIFVWGTINGWHALERAYARWPEKRLGTSLVFGALIVLSTGMLVLRGAIPGTEIQLSAGAAVLLVLSAVLWIVSPAVIVALRFTARTRSRLVH